MSYNISIVKYIPKFLKETRWKQFAQVIDSVLQDIYDEYLDDWFKFLKKELATFDDFVNIIKSLGYPINLNYLYDETFIKKMALTITERIRLKTTPTAYERLFYALGVKGYIYPLVEINNALVALLNYDEITDIIEYLNSVYVEEIFELTKHFDLRVEPKYVVDWTTSYYLTRPKHHYKLTETYGNFVMDAGTYPNNGTHNLNSSNLNQPSIISGIGCYLFDGITNRIDTNYYISNVNKTISFWAKKVDLTNNQIVFGSEDSIGNKFFFGFQNTGFMGAGISSQDWDNQFDILSIIPTFVETDWHWYCITFNNGIGRTNLYVDNILIGYTLTSNRISELDYYIGCRNNNGTDDYFFNGYISDFRIYEYVVAEETRDDIYNSGNGRIENVLKTDDIGQFLEENTLKVMQYEFEKIKMHEEVPHFSSTLNLNCNESGIVCSQIVYDSEGNVFENGIIQTIVTNNWLKIEGIAFDIINPDSGDYYKFDDTIAWKWDTTKEGWLDNISKIVLGQGLQTEVLASVEALQIPVYEHDILEAEKSETYIGGTNNSGQYIIDVDVGRPSDIYWVTEIGLYNSNGLLIFYAKTPRLNRTSDYRFRFKITIDKN